MLWILVLASYCSHLTEGVILQDRSRYGAGSPHACVMEGLAGQPCDRIMPAEEH